MKPFIFSWGLIFLAALFDTYAALIVKMRFKELGVINFGSLQSIISYILKMISSPLLFSAIFAYVLAPVLWFFALNRIDLSVGYPVLVIFHLVFITLFAFLFLKEGMTIYKIIGLVLFILSLYFFYKQK